ncbi:MAG TPA: hypothetical protein VMJ12_03165 [Candidatus Acidoferrales bacterium]|nr:hypothetical protein [Candidatus Acidoferrales bacterium]
MRLSKLCLVVCAVTLCATIPTVRADDNPNQAAARAALEQQMQSLDAQQASQNAPAAAPAAPTRPAPPVAPAASATPPPATNPPAAMTQAPTNPAAASVPPVTAAPTVAPARTTAPAASATANSGNSLFGPVPPPSGGMPAGTTLEEPTPSSTTSAAPTAVQTQAPVAAPYSPMASSQNQNDNSANNPGKILGLKPIVAPALPISIDQQGQLQALLQKYEAGTISPVEYQAERQKILNQPH